MALSFGYRKGRYLYSHLDISWVSFQDTYTFGPIARRMEKTLHRRRTPKAAPVGEGRPDAHDFAEPGIPNRSQSQSWRLRASQANRRSFLHLHGFALSFNIEIFDKNIGRRLLPLSP